jgi:hypothetical protein
MRRFAVVGLALVAGCAQTPGHSQGGANPSQPEDLMRDGARATLNSTQSAVQVATCYAKAVTNRGDGLVADAQMLDATPTHQRWQVKVWEAGRPEHTIGLINVAQVGTGSTSEMYMRRRGSVEGFRRFLAERC